MEFRHHSSHDIPAPHLLQSIPRDELDNVLSLLSNEDVDFGRLARAIQPQPAIAALIIRTVNAVTVGNQQPVRSLKHAIAFLGLERTRNTLLEASDQLSFRPGERSSVA